MLALFLLQTRFRAELQEDTFYAEYLSKKTSTVVRIDKNAAQDAKIDALEKEVARLLSQERTESLGEVKDGKPASDDKLDWSSWPVALNERHPNFRRIRSALRDAGIPVDSVFGADSEGTPSKWIISISHHLPRVHAVHLLRTIISFEFDGFQFWEPHRDVGEEEDVYIGSYGNDEYAKITDELMELLKNSVEKIDLYHYYNKNTLKRKETK